MKNHCIENLQEIRKILEYIPEKAFGTPLSVLSDSSIGQHIRHILELYLAVFESLNTGVINYDKRKRNPIIEQNPNEAINLLDKIIEFLAWNKSDQPLNLEGNFSSGESKSITIPTSLYRELAYNLEHSIHHQALIKIGCMELDLKHLLDENFGVAPATVRYRKEKLARS
ncbi:hypothetical protein [Fontibacter flavus]|uniref:DinB family protein n=1 Tax=Fontibacter flavus TaxID=654838 RepID=A0ABV6FXK9_9BACT